MLAAEARETDTTAWGFTRRNSKVASIYKSAPGFCICVRGASAKQRYPLGVEELERPGPGARDWGTRKPPPPRGLPKAPERGGMGWVPGLCRQVRTQRDLSAGPGEVWSLEEVSPNTVSPVMA